MALLTLISSAPSSFSLSLHRPPRTIRRFSLPIASLSSSSPSSSPEYNPSESVPFSTSLGKKPFVEPTRPPDSSFNYAVVNPNSNPVVRLSRSTESTIERVIFDFRFLALLAIGGSLAGSLLCFLNGCVYIVDAYKVYWTCCLKGVHTGQMVLRLVEAIG
ncbi:PREDICTED: uncharacterized protein LOC104585917 [Nelumbo nucifera]|uniref:Uncharacterized protein LOC104585917 n=1 Tax=Nelumbo nucifera TaxID=4432 RepID=A0A1U7Z3I3_NELNU|nr:PREDICTED: uncharacterized protein LOC104585917 [Nelumbo nucifera]